MSRVTSETYLEWEMYSFTLNVQSLEIKLGSEEFVILRLFWHTNGCKSLVFFYENEVPKWNGDKCPNASVSNLFSTESLAYSSSSCEFTVHVLYLANNIHVWLSVFIYERLLPCFEMRTEMSNCFREELFLFLFMVYFCQLCNHVDFWKFVETHQEWS